MDFIGEKSLVDKEILIPYCEHFFHVNLGNSIHIELTLRVFIVISDIMLFTTNFAPDR